MEVMSPPNKNEEIQKNTATVSIRLSRGNLLGANSIPKSLYVSGKSGGSGGGLNWAGPFLFSAMLMGRQETEWRQEEKILN